MKAPQMWYRIFFSASSAKPNFKKLLLAIVLGLILLFLIDPIFGLIIRSLFKRTDLFNLPKTELSPIVFSGSSQMMASVSPQLFTQDVQSLTGQSLAAINLSPPGATTPISRDVIRNLAIPADAKVVIYGIELRALNRNDVQNGVLASFQQTDLGYAISDAPNLDRAILLWFLQHSFIFRYGEIIKQRFIDQNEASSDIEDIEVTDSGLGFHPFYQKADPSTYQDLLRQYYVFTPDSSMLNALSDIVTDCQQSKVQCIVVNMPIHDDLQKIIPPKDEAAYEQTLRDRVIGKVMFWDMNTPGCRAIFDNDFMDWNHLLIQGSSKFTAIVSTLYVQYELKQTVSSVGDAACAQVSPAQ